MHAPFGWPHRLPSSLEERHLSGTAARTRTRGPETAVRKSGMRRVMRSYVYTHGWEENLEYIFSFFIRVWQSHEMHIECATTYSSQRITRLTRGGASPVDSANKEGNRRGERGRGTDLHGVLPDEGDPARIASDGFSSLQTACAHWVRPLGKRAARFQPAEREITASGC